MILEAALKLPFLKKKKEKEREREKAKAKNEPVFGLILGGVSYCLNASLCATVLNVIVEE